MSHFQRRHTVRLLSSIASVLLATQLASAQQPTDNQLLGKQAVHVVLQHVLIMDKTPVPRTGAQLPLNGHWSIGKDAPPACPPATAGSSRPCLSILYAVPDVDVTCEWVVLLDSDGVNGSLLDQNDDATRYFLQKLSPEAAKPLVLNRGKPIYPPIAEAAHVKGDVVVRIQVGPDGKVLRHAIVSGPPMLQTAAKDAVEGWTFQPLKIGSHPVTFQTEIKFQFITNGPPDGTITTIP